MSKCIQIHEKIHLLDYQCPNRCTAMSAGNYKPGITDRQSECFARKPTDVCLRTALRRCLREGNCDANEIWDLIQESWKVGNAVCNGLDPYFNGTP